MKKKKFHHITKEERKEIGLFLKKKHSLRNIAEMLKRSVSSLSEEINRNKVREVYDPEKAEAKARLRRKNSKYQGMKVVGNSKLRDYVEKNLEEDWSPDEISGRIKNIDKDIKYVSRMAIYKFVYSVYGRQLERYLRRKGKKKRSAASRKVSQLKNRTFIEERPEIISKRERFGDWEGDLIVSGRQGKGALLVVCERKAKFTIIKKLLKLSPSLINQHFQEITGGLACIGSLTLDNDLVFRKHEELSAMLATPIYFCHPYHSWEKGGVENINGLIRQYIPKSSDISHYSEEYIKEIETKLNNRPRKCLNYKTPLEVMLENQQFKTLEDFGIIKKQKTPVAGVRIEG